MVRRQRLRFWQGPSRGDCFHPRQRRAWWSHGRKPWLATLVPRRGIKHEMLGYAVMEPYGRSRRGPLRLLQFLRAWGPHPAGLQAGVDSASVRDCHVKDVCCCTWKRDCHVKPRHFAPTDVGHCRAASPPLQLTHIMLRSVRACPMPPSRVHLRLRALVVCTFSTPRTAPSWHAALKNLPPSA